MNKNIKLAVAGAVLALSATAANAGIIIPAGEWTMDINGNVNAFANYTHADTATGTSLTSGTATQYATGLVKGAMASAPAASGLNQNKQLGINTGLLPSWLGFTGTTRQNDLDVSFTISMQPRVSDNGDGGDGGTPLFRQSYLTFGDKSWGSIKLGKDLGIFAADAILNDMTLLGVGGGAAQSGANTTFGGIGTGYIYAAWKGQIAYTTPNFSGFQGTVGITNPNQITNAGTRNQDRYGLEGKASYSFAQGDFTGKVWVSGATYDVTVNATQSYTATAGDIGANLNAGGFGLTGYWYQGSGAGTTTFGAQGTATTYTTASGVETATASANKRDSDGGYIQLTYVTPFKTKVGAAYGISSLELASGETAASNNTVKDNERYTLGLYHPLTKHLNLVAEYNNVESKAHNGAKAESNTYSAGAILFF